MRYRDTMMDRKYPFEGAPKRLLIWLLTISMFFSIVILAGDGDSQTAPLYGDPDIGVTFGSSDTHFQNNMNVANVTGKVDCRISTNTPDGTKVLIDLILEDEYEFHNMETLVFEKGGEMEKDFKFRFFIKGEFVQGEKIVITLSTHWEYLSPEEGSGDLAPITNSVTIGPYGELEVIRVQPQGMITLEKHKWRTIEVMIQNHGNTEERVMISVLENPSRLEVDLKKGFLMVAPFGEFPFTFTIRCTDNRDIDSYLTLKVDTFVNGNVEASHRIKVEMEKEEEGIDLTSTAVLVMIPIFLFLFFGGMIFFWMRILFLRKGEAGSDGPDHPFKEEVS